MRRLTAGAVALALCGAPPDAARAQDSADLAPGVRYRRVARADGPWELHVVAVALRAPGVRVDLARARPARLRGGLAGRERTSAMAARWCEPGRRAVAAVNADLFDMRTGETEGVLVAAGEVLHAAPAAESPWDAFDNAHAALAVDGAGRAAVARLAFAGALVAPGVLTHPAPLDGVNVTRAPGGGAPGAVLFTPPWGRLTPRWGGADAPAPRREVAYASARRRGDTLVLRGPRPGAAGGGTRIPRGGAVLSVAPDAPAARAFGAGAPAELRARLAFSPPPAGPGGWRTVSGGWGRLLAGGADVSAAADSLEGTFPGFSRRRHPRTAAALTAGGDTLLLVAVDGRRADSPGMTFGELAAALRALGAADALNLDGGGSTTVALLPAAGGAPRVANRPSDAAGERPVGSALLVTVPAAGRRCAPGRPAR